MTNFKPQHEPNENSFAYLSVSSLNGKRRITGGKSRGGGRRGKDKKKRRFRCNIWSGDPQIPKRCSRYPEWGANDDVESSKTAHGSPIHYRGRVHRLLMRNKRCIVVTSNTEGTRNTYSNNSIHRQRTSNEAHQNTNIPSANEVSRAQVPPCSAGSRDTRNKRIGAPSRHIHGTDTNEYCEDMEERTFNTLVEWLEHDMESWE